MKAPVMQIIRAIPDQYKVTVTHPSSGSVYLTIHGCAKLKLIRIANHKGHAQKAKQWDYRSDAMTTRKGNGRVYHTSALNSLLNDLKKL